MYPHKACGGNRIFVVQHHGVGLRACGRIADAKRDGAAGHAVGAEIAAAFAKTFVEHAVFYGGGVNLHGGSPWRGWMGFQAAFELRCNVSK